MLTLCLDTDRTDGLTLSARTAMHPSLAHSLEAAEDEGVGKQSLKRDTDLRTCNDLTDRRRDIREPPTPSEAVAALHPACHLPARYRSRSTTPSIRAFGMVTTLPSCWMLVPSPFRPSHPFGHDNHDASPQPPAPMPLHVDRSLLSLIVQLISSRRAFCLCHSSSPGRRG